MTIKIYPSRLPGEPLETHQHAVMTIHDWMNCNVKGYSLEKRHQIAIEVNGSPVKPSEWPLCFISPDSDVRIYPVPHGLETATILAIVSVAISVAAAAYSIYMMSKLGGTSAADTGTALSLSTAKGNSVSLGDPIREVFGQYQVYPDYITQPLMRFDASSPEKMVTTMFLCVGVGSFSIPQSGVRIGTTPITSFSDDAAYTIFGPGADVSADARSENWWESTEVGGTSSSSGLDMQSTAPDSVYVSADAILFSGNTITLIGSTSSDDDDTTTVVPTSWAVGSVIDVVAPDTFTIGTSSGASVIYGDFTEVFPASIGSPIRVVFNDNTYDLFVATYTPAVAAVPGVGGNAASVLASAAPTTYDFSTTSYTFNITWNGVVYTVNLVANYTTMSGLIEAITDALTGSGLVAQDDSGKVLITEKSSPYTGNTIVNTALPVAVFGDAPVNTAGTASSGGSAGSDAAVTLAYDSATGAAFNGIPVGTQRLSLLYGTGQFQITAIDDTTITVARLLINGSSTSVDPDWGGFTARTILDASVSGDDDATNWLGPFMACPDGQTTSTLEANFTFPSGHIQYKANGDSQSHSVRVILQYRNSAVAGAWTQVAYDFKGQTVNGHGYTKTITGLNAARYEVRVRRTTKIGGSRTVNNIYWQALRCKLSARAASYVGVTTMGVTVRTGARLAAQSDRRINLLATRLYTTGVSRSISGAFAHICDDMGISYDSETLSELESANWTPDGDHFDYATDDTSTVLDMLQMITNAGRSFFLFTDGMASASRDAVKPWSGMITPAEQTEALTTAFKAITSDDYDGVDVTYINASTWASETVQCRLPNLPTPNKTETYKLDGVTSQDKAYQIGMRRLMRYQLQRLTYTTTTNLEALCYKYGDRIVFADDIPDTYKTITSQIDEYSVSGGVAKIVIGEPIPWSDYANPRIIVKYQDGTASAPLVVTRIDDYSFTTPYIAGFADFDFSDPSIDPPVVLFCDSSQAGYDGVISEIAPNSDGTVDVTALNYDPNIYQYDSTAYPGDAE